MTKPVDLEVLDDFFKPKDQMLGELRETMDGTVLEGIPDELEQEVDLTWMDVMYERREEVLPDHVIGTDGLSAHDLVDNDELTRLLIDDNRCNWYDPTLTLATLHGLTGKRLEETFETDKDLIEHVEENDDNGLFNDVEDIREAYREVRQVYEDREDSIFSMMFEPDTDLVFSRVYIELSNRMKIPIKKLTWETEPEVGQYATITKTVHQSAAENTDVAEGKTFVIVGKFVDMQTESLNIAERMDENEEAVVDINSYEFQPVAYDNDLLEAYPEHPILTAEQGDDDRYIGPTNEERIDELYDENERPLEDVPE